MLGTYFIWEHVFYKDFDEAASSVALMEQFQSKSAPVSIIEILNSKGLAFSTSKEIATDYIVYREIKVPSYYYLDLEGELKFTFLNDELEFVRFEPLNVNLFSEKLYEVFKFPKDAKDIEQFFISENQYMYKRFKQREGDKVYFVWVDQNMRKKYLWLMRRYGSD